MSTHARSEVMYDGAFIDPIIGEAIQRNNLNYKWYV